jgi:hypothetical protein
MWRSSETKSTAAITIVNGFYRARAGRSTSERKTRLRRPRAGPRRTLVWRASAESAGGARLCLESFVSRIKRGTHHAIMPRNL